MPMLTGPKTQSAWPCPRMGRFFMHSPRPAPSDAPSRVGAGVVRTRGGDACIALAGVAFSYQALSHRGRCKHPLPASSPPPPLRDTGRSQRGSLLKTYPCKRGLLPPGHPRKHSQMYNTNYTFAQILFMPLLRSRLLLQQQEPRQSQQLRRLPRLPQHVWQQPLLPPLWGQ